MADDIDFERLPTDALLSTAQAKLALVWLGLGRISLPQRRYRGDGPPAVKRGHKLLWSWGDLLRWATEHRSRSDFRGTALGDWMWQHGWSVVSLGAHWHMGQVTIYRMLGHRNRTTAAITAAPNADIVERVSALTGIAVERLVEDMQERRKAAAE